MADKYIPDAKEPHIHEHNGGIDFTAVGHAHKKLLEGNMLREQNCIAVIDDLKAKGPKTRENQIIDYIKALVRQHKKGK
jgi:hypothetical protein